MIHEILLPFVGMLACGCYYTIKKDSFRFVPLAWGIYALLLAVALYSFLSAVLFRIQNPAIWDFTAFYLYGKVAASGYNFYLPESYQHVLNTINLPFKDIGSLQEEVVNVGFPYPPPTILYFLPLGFLSYKTALVTWSLINLFFVIACIYLMYDMFLKSDKLNGLVLVCILFLLSTQVRSTIFYSQTNFILLTLLLLMRRNENSGLSGIFLTLAIFTKPYLAIFSLYFIFTKRWKSVVYMIISAVVISLITLVIVGQDTFVSYFLNNSASRLPKWVFSEGINQSLHAVLLRANLISLDKPIVYASIVGIIMSIIIVPLFHLVKSKKTDLLWVYLLLVGLILYPGTLSYYGVLLYFILFMFIADNQPFMIEYKWYIPFAGIYLYLSMVSVFSLICFLIVVTIVITFRKFIDNKSDIFHKLA